MSIGQAIQDKLDRKIDLIFGGCVLVKGVDGNMHWIDAS